MDLANKEIKALGDNIHFFELKDNKKTIVCFYNFRTNIIYIATMRGNLSTVFAWYSLAYTTR